MLIGKVWLVLMETTDANLAIVILFSLIGGLFSLIGGFLLLARKKTARSLATYATPFAAGALLAAAFLDLLGEASHVGDIDSALTGALIGIVGFFLLERFLRWFHHHHEHNDNGNKRLDANASLIVIGDSLHNFIDGIAIAAAFLVNIPTGIVAAIAVAAHEIPQEIGDFGLLLKKGMSRRGVILVNVFSALATTVAAIIFFQLGQNFELPLDWILGIVAGFFIYIATSDIIPSIHKNEERRLAGPQTILLIAGVIIVGIVTTTLHDFIDTDENHSHGTEATEQHDEHDEHEAHDHHEDGDEDHHH